MNKITDKFILAAVLLVPLISIAPIKGTIVWYPQLLALLAIGLCLLSLSMWNMNKAICILLIYQIFSYIFVCNQSPRSLICLITGFSGMLFAYVVSKSSNTKILKFLMFVGVLNLVLVAMQIFNHDPFFIKTGGGDIDNIVGFIGSRDQLAIFQACVSILLSAISPWLLLFCIPAFIVKCSSVLFSLSLTGCFYLFITKRWKISACVLLCVLTLGFIWVTFGSKSEEFSERLRLWNLTSSQAISAKVINDDNKHIISSNPIFGFGIGNFFVFSPFSQKNVVGKLVSHRYEHAHNDFIEGWFEFGYIGIMLMIWCFISIILDFIQALHLSHPNNNNLIISFCALFCMFISSLGVYVFHAPVSLFMFCLILGLFYREVNYANTSKIKQAS